VYTYLLQIFRSSQCNPRLKFYHMSNCIYSKSKDANSEMVTIELPKSYCLPSILYVVEATLWPAANVRVFQSCINRALYKIFGACDRSRLDYFRVCVKLDGMKQLTEGKHCAFIEQLLDDCWFSNLLLMHVQNSIFSIGVCVNVCMRVCVWLHSTVLLFLVLP